MQLGNIGTEKPASSYTFFTGDLDSLANELAEEKQETGVIEAPEIEEEENLVQLETNREKPLSRPQAQIAKSTGKLMTAVVDTPVRIACGFISKTDGADFGASADEKETLADAFEEYFKEQGVNIPPWAVLLMVVLSVYSPKFIAAVQLRKANAIADEQAAKIKSLEAALAERTEDKDKAA